MDLLVAGPQGHRGHRVVGSVGTRGVAGVAQRDPDHTGGWGKGIARTPVHQSERQYCAAGPAGRGVLKPVRSLEVLVHLAQVLVLLVRHGLDLERRVADVEVGGDAVGEDIEYGANT